VGKDINDMIDELGLSIVGDSVREQVRLVFLGGHFVPELLA
jgi:hypothetical protein